MNNSKLTWNEVLNNNNINLLEHPVYGGLIEKAEFQKEFGLLLEELNGEDEYPTPDCYFGFFMESNPCMTSSLKFIGEDEKADFIDMAVEKGLMHSMGEIYQSETFESEFLRKEEEAWNAIDKLGETEIAEIEAELEKLRLKNIEKQKQNKIKRTESRSDFFKEYIKLYNIWCGCQKNFNLMKESNDDKKESYRKKFMKSFEIVKKLYNEIITKYENKLEDYPEYDEKVAETVKEILNFINTN